MLRDLMAARLMNIPLEKRRNQLEEAARRGIRLPRQARSRGVEVCGREAEWVEPAGGEPGRSILYLHGGGYVMGSINTHRGLAGRIALAAQARLLVIDYRLAPEHPYPAALEDATAAYRWMLEQGIDPSHMSVGGDSAGGGLALATALSLREAGLPLPGALFLLSPWTDLTLSGDSIRERAERDPVLTLGDDWFETSYAGSHSPTDPLISPLFGDLRGLPPCLIQVGSEEILFDDSARLARRLEEAGVENRMETWEGMWHVFQAYAPYAPEAQQAINQIGEFLKLHIQEAT